MDQRYLSGRQPRPPAERRTQDRLRVELPARDPEGHTWRVHDISRAGLCLVTDQPLEQGSALDLDLTDTASGRSCRFQAQVVWIAPGQPGRAGLRFTPLSPEQGPWLNSRFSEGTSAGPQTE